ncbi:MAG: hypothetical protein FWF85_03745 [Clostridiales bacterium]|nr:hypothetical protein [Clostridiales bacterium]
MFINLTIETLDGRQDIRIDSEQKIGSGLFILRQSGKLPSGPAPDYFHSLLNQNLVSAFKTFQEEGIFDGDVLRTFMSRIEN